MECVFRAESSTKMIVGNAVAVVAAALAPVSVLRLPAP
jgi:hypothetical protein